MPKIHVSPGAYFKTIDLSAYIPRLTKSSYGVVGRFRKGPTDPVVVDDPQTFIDIFGEPEKGMWSALSALLYLENGDQLYIKRLVGTNAMKSTAEIPAGRIIQNEPVLKTDGYDYQLHMALSSTPLPGTLVLKIGNNTFYDNGHGKIVGSATSLYCNYIDYDSGLFRFTLKEAPKKDERVEIRYNGKLFIISNEKLGETDGTLAFNGMLKRAGLFFPDKDFKVQIRVGNRLIEGNEFNADGKLVLKSPDDATVKDEALIDPLTGEVTINFDPDPSAPEIPDKTAVMVDYDTYTEQTTLVGIGDGSTRAFSGYISARVSPGTSSIWVNDVLISQDLKNGDYVGNNLVYSDNSVDYMTGAIKMALTYEPDADTIVSATYSTKADTLLHVFDDPSKPKSFEAQFEVFPVIKGSVEVLVDTLYLKDDGEGNLVGTAGNGRINYENGKMSINLKDLPVLGTTVRARFLAKFGEMKALYHGEYGDGFKGKFSVKPNLGYTLELWTQNQNPEVDSPDEFWNHLNFVDKAAETYITSKVSSYHIEIIPNTESKVYLEPLLGQVFTTTGGVSDIENVTEDEVISALRTFENPENYDINILTCPDFPGNKRIINAMISVCESRGECICVFDPPSGLTPRQACDWTNGESSWNQTTKFDSSFAAVYYPWIRVNNPATKSTEMVPPSVVIPTMYTYTDNIAASWYAPAGVNRGKLTRAVDLERKLTLEDRDLIYGYPNIINPIVNIPGQGITVWGQKTAQRKATSLDRISVRRLMNYISKVMSTAFMELLFEPNDHISWTKYKQIVEPILEEIQATRGLYSCRVVCDQTTNPASVIERNEMHARIYLQPMKTVEIIDTTYILTGLGATAVTN